MPIFLQLSRQEVRKSEHGIARTSFGEEEGVIQSVPILERQSAFQLCLSRQVGDGVEGVVIQELLQGGVLRLNPCFQPVFLDGNDGRGCFIGITQRLSLLIGQRGVGGEQDVSAGQRVILVLSLRIVP